jgi:hypothetical protein
MNSCQQFEDDLITLADGELAAELATLVQAHLGECAACREELARLQESLALATSVWQQRAEAAGEPIPTRKLSAGETLFDKSPSHKTIVTSRAIGLATAAAAVVLLIAAAGLWWWNGVGSSDLVAGLDSGGTAASGGDKSNMHTKSNDRGSHTDANDADAAAARRAAMEAELAELRNEIEDAAQAARLTAAAKFLGEQPGLEKEYESALRYIERRGD